MMEGVIVRYKEDIKRAFLQLTESNIVGNYVGLSLDLNDRGVLIGDKYSFIVGEVGNELFKDKNFTPNMGIKIGSTYLKLNRGDSQKLVVGFKEITIAGFPKYKVITLDITQVQDYFKKNYGKKSIADIVTHLESIKGTLIQTSFFTIDSLPSSVIVKNAVSKRSGLPIQTASPDDLPQVNYFASLDIDDNNNGLELAIDEGSFFSYKRAFDFSETFPSLLNKVKGIDGFQPELQLKDKMFLGLESDKIVKNKTEFFSSMLRYENTGSSTDFYPIYKGNGMLSVTGGFDYKNCKYLYKGKKYPIVGVYSTGKPNQYAVVFMTFDGRTLFSIKKSDFKTQTEFELVDSKKLSEIRDEFKIILEQETQSNNSILGKKLAYYNSNIKGSFVSNKDEEFSQGLKLLNAEKIKQLKSKNPKFSEAFDLAVGQIYEVFKNTKEVTKKPIKYFVKPNPFLERYIKDSALKMFSDSDLLDLDKIFYESNELATNIRTFEDVVLWNKLQTNFGTTQKIIFLNEPPIGSINDFFKIYSTDYKEGQTRIIIGRLYFIFDGLGTSISKDLREKLLTLINFIAKKGVTYSVKILPTINIIRLLSVYDGAKLLEYYSKQIDFLIRANLILSKSELMGIHNALSKFKSLSTLTRLYLFGLSEDATTPFKISESEEFEYKKNIGELESLFLDVIPEMIERASKNNASLNEWFNKEPIQVVEPIIEEPQIITTEPQVVEDDDFADIFAEAQEVEEKLKELQQQVAQQETEIDDLDL